MAHGAGKSRDKDIAIILALGLAAVVGGHMTATTIDHWLAHGLGLPHLAIFALALVLALGAAFWAWRWRESTRKLFAKLEQLPARNAPRRALVCFLSTQRALTTAPPPSGPVTIPMGPDKAAELPRENAQADAETLDRAGRWNWEQLLRGIGAHAGKIQWLYLIGSGDLGTEKGSFAQLPIAEGFLRPYLKGARIQSAPSPVDFENYENLRDALDDAINEAKKLGIPDREICVDITGGQKPTSAAGTIATLNRDVVLQYVQTGGQKQALIYDVHYEGVPEIGH